MAAGAVVIVGDTQGLGRRLAERFTHDGHPVVISDREANVAAEDLTAVQGVAIERGSNTLRDYDIVKAIRLVTLKLVGYIHALRPAPHYTRSVVLYGGLTKERPYPDKTTVTSVNGAVDGVSLSVDGGSVFG